MTASEILVNPFSLTKANDLTDDQIQELWVDVAPADSPESLLKAGRFASPMPTFILGSKGSGKTHLMRYASFALQKKRFHLDQVSVIDGVRADGYVGIYLLCSGLETGRFHGKGQSDEAWQEVFAYHLELTLGIAALEIVAELILSEPQVEGDYRQFCAQVSQLFEANPVVAEGIENQISELRLRRKALDYLVNNSAFAGELKPEISVGRGKLIFGIPRAVATCIPALRGVLFTYQLDELENLTEVQQQHINTLVRDRNGPATLKIGARQYGIKTYSTMSAGEVNVKDSEFEELRLDQRFRRNEKVYKNLVTKLVERRLQTFWPPSSASLLSRSKKLSDWFEEPVRGTFDPFYASLVRSGAVRPHLVRLRDALEAHVKRGAVPGMASSKDVDQVLNAVTVAEAPLVEKLNTFLIFNAWAKDQDLLKASRDVHLDCSEFLSGRGPAKYRQKLEHYKSDLVAQMIRDSSNRQRYGGLEEFTRMSEGQPRALITLLKQTFDWAAFQGEQPFQSNPIGVDAESKGALAASEWFYNSMRKADKDGQAILRAIDRLAELFRINRYADNPIECSLIGFSVSPRVGSEVARRVLRLAVDHSFLVDVFGGQSERNSEQITGKYQLNRMLAPKWGLPTSRRGIKPLNEGEINAIFDSVSDDAFDVVRADWNSRMYAPFEGARRQPSSLRAEDQYDLLP